MINVIQINPYKRDVYIIWNTILQLQNSDIVNSLLEALMAEQYQM